MSIEDALDEWNSKKRRMGCVSATEWFCKRVPGFYPKRLIRDYPHAYWEHSVATNGVVQIDLTPHLDAPDLSQQ